MTSKTIRKEHKERVRRLDDYTIKRIVKLKDDGVSSIAIAQRLDIAPSTVDRIARNNSDRRRAQAFYSDDELLTIVEMFMEGCSNLEIARKTNRTYWAIANKLCSMGLKRAYKFAISRQHPWHVELRQSYKNRQIKLNR